MSYTAQQVFEWGSALIMEKAGEDPDSAYFTPAFLSIAMQEALPYENAQREQKGLAALEEAPVITALTQRLEDGDGNGWDPTIVRVALPYLLASHYFRDNNDGYHEQLFFSLYQSTVLDIAAYKVEPIRDFYGE